MSKVSFPATVWRLWRQQWLPLEQLAALRLRLLRYLVTHAYERVPYYRERWRNLGLHPSDITSEVDLQKFPSLSKAELQNRPARDFLTEGADIHQTISYRTSGSTGRPLNVYLSRSENQMANHITTRANIASGSRPWRRRAMLRAIDRIPEHHGLLRHIRLELPSGRDPQDYLQVLLEYRPAEIHGYSQSLRQLAQLLIDQRICDLRPQFVLGTAELVTPRDRELINTAFRVSMVDHYASIEARSMAWECSCHSGYHLNSDTHIFEFVKDGQAAKPGVPAQIVVTPLHFHTMPLIRYEIGDTAALSTRTCACGRTLPLMEMLEGRRDDSIVLASGRHVLPVGSFANVIEAETDVVEYFVTQEKVDLIVVQLVLRSRHAESVPSRVQNGIRELVQGEAAVNVITVDSIQREGGSKLRRIASRVE